MRLVVEKEAMSSSSRSVIGSGRAQVAFVLVCSWDGDIFAATQNGTPRKSHFALLVGLQMLDQAALPILINDVGHCSTACSSSSMLPLVNVLGIRLLGKLTTCRHPKAPNQCGTGARNNSALGR